MAQKREKRALQIEVKNQEEWDGLMQQKGLVVVDAFSNWCGPCKAMVSVFSKIRITLECDTLFFATADTDGIDSLAGYRGKSEPTFLFYGDGQLVNVLRGCNGPMMNKLINILLKQESQIAEGNIEREIFIDKVVSKEPEPGEKQDDTKDGQDEVIEEVVQKNIMIAVIKPDVVQASIVEQICEEVVNAGFDIVEKVERVLTNEEVAEFYRQDEGDGFEQLIEFMASGPCVALAVSKAGDVIGDEIISEFMTLVGPADVNTAKEEAPESIRAKYGTDSLHNAIDCSISLEDATRELVFFFPDFVAQTFRIKSSVRKTRERTIAIIRPNAAARRDSVIKIIEDGGFAITLQKEITFSKEQAEEFYSQHKDEEFYENLIANMTSGLSIALCLEKTNAVEEWAEMLIQNEIVETTDEEESDAKVSLQAKFSPPSDLPCEPLHASESIAEFEREINFLFPMENAVIVIKPGVADEITKDIISRVKHDGFNVAMETEIIITSEQASLLYKENRDEDYFAELLEYMSSGTSLLLILSGEDAICRLQTLLGPIQPENAKEDSPNSIRGTYGEDVVHNVIYGSTNKENTLEIIENFFPDIVVDDNGLVVVPYAGEDIEDAANATDENAQVDNEPAQSVDETDASPTATEADVVAEGEAIPAESTSSNIEIEASEVESISDPDGNQVPSVAGEAGAEKSPSVSREATLNEQKTDESLPSDPDGKLQVNDEPASAETSGEPTLDGPASAEASGEPTLDGPASAEANDEPTLDGPASTEVSREPTLDVPASSEVSREPTLDGAASTEVSREPTLDGVASTGVSREPTLDGPASTDVSREPTLDETSTEVSREGTLDETSTELSDTNPTADEGITE